MENVIKELEAIVAQFQKKISAIPETEFSSKPRSDKWSKKEVVGHLIDSAQNNLRRFVVAQYDTTPPQITYEQDAWVASNNYGKIPSADVIALWRLINLQVASVLRTMPRANYDKTCNTGRKEAQLHSLAWLAEDYVKHLKHHLNQVIPGSFDITYP